MKINEASVIDDKVIDYVIRTLIADGNNVLAQELKQHLIPLEPIVRDVVDYEGNKSDYINETEI
jgi:hypothetical protein